MLLLAVTFTAQAAMASGIDTLPPNLARIDRENETSLRNSGSAITKAIIFLADSSFWLGANMRQDHRIFLYEKPGLTSRKLMLFSIFTNDVEGNPFRLPFGAYYETSSLSGAELKFSGQRPGQFVELLYLKDGGTPVQKMYVLRKWVRFRKQY